LIQNHLAAKFASFGFLFYRLVAAATADGSRKGIIFGKKQCPTQDSLLLFTSISDNVTVSVADSVSN
jgi:hypothetical protein